MEWIGVKDNYLDYQGFVYRITNLKTNRFYLGKKNIWAKTKKKLARKPTTLETKRLEKYKSTSTLKYKDYKKKLKLKYKGKKKVIRNIIESDWKDYTGSSVYLNDDIEKLGLNNFKREILYYCKTKTEMSWLELLEQIKYDVLNNDMSYNGIIHVRLNRTK